MKKQRARLSPMSGTLAFIFCVIAAAGIAFAGGSHLRARFPEHVLQRQQTQLAQADPRGLNPRERGAVRVKPAPKSEDVGIGPLETFMQVYTLVKENYVDKLPEERKMAHGAIRAMLAELNDPNSRFFEPEEREALEAEARGRYAGIGAALSPVGQKRDGYTEYKITVVAPLPGSPAEKAGLRPGDIITGVDGKWVLGADPFVEANRVLKRVQARDAEEEELQKAVEAAQERVKSGISLAAAQKKLTLGEGEKRAITVQRPGVKDPIKLELTTAITQVTPVTTKALAGGVGYIKLAAFTDKSGAAFKEALASLPRQPGLVLDLRGNPGGMLAPVKEIAAALTRGGNLFVEVGPGNKRRAVGAPVAKTAAPQPVVVLVDRGTASSAEALAAALSDKKIGTLVGSKTFGDALVQTLYPLPDGSAYTLTTGKLQGPGGAQWQNVGLTPGVAVAQAASEEQVLARAVAVLKNRPNVAAAPAR